MNRLLLCSELLFLVSTPLVADPEIPASAWEQHPEGVAVAMLLSAPPEKAALNVYTKNVSETDKLLYSRTDAEIRIYYINDAKARIPLRACDDDPLSYSGNYIIKKGQVHSETITLTSDESAAVRAHPVSCSFGVYDMILKKGFMISSAPNLLGSQK